MIKEPLEMPIIHFLVNLYTGQKCHRSCNGRCWGPKEDQCQRCKYVIFISERYITLYFSGFVLIAFSSKLTVRSSLKSSVLFVCLFFKSWTFKRWTINTNTDFVLFWGQKSTLAEILCGIWLAVHIAASDEWSKLSVTVIDNKCGWSWEKNQLLVRLEISSHEFFWIFSKFYYNE